MAHDDDDARTDDEAAPQDEGSHSDEFENEDEEPEGIPAELMMPALVVGTILIGALLGAVIVLAWISISDDEQPAPVTSITRVEPSAALPETGPTRLERCASAAEALESPLKAARPALDQWEVHVGAMNKLVVGAITLQQATDFWNRTRVGAHNRVEGFNDSVVALRREGVDCPLPGLLAPGARDLRLCARQVQAEIALLRAARTSIGTWEQHVHHMDMLRMGELSPERATEMWLATWRQGVRDLDDYHRAARDARLSAGCTAESSD